MTEQITRNIRFVSQAGKHRPAQMHLATYAPPERKKRALKALLGYWLLSVLSIPIMIAHFILVPGFFIAGILVAFKRWKTVEEAENASGQCPACDNRICIGLEKKSELPQWHDCPECSEPLELQNAPETAGREPTGTSSTTP